MNELRAQLLADVLNGESWNSGCGIWLVIIRRADGRVVAMSDEVVCEYASEDEVVSGQPATCILLK